MNITKNFKITLIISIIFSIIAIILGISIGSTDISLRDICTVFAHLITKNPFPEEFKTLNFNLIVNLRLPRVLLAFLVGGGLSVSGCILQSLLKNPLASAYSLGVSSAAGLAASLVMIFYAGTHGYIYMVILGILASFLTVCLVMFFAQITDKSLSTNTVILTGMVISFFLNALMTTLAASSAELASRIMLWQLGSFASRGYTGVIVLSVVLPCIIVIFMILSPALDIMSFGNSQANAIGVNTKILSWIFILLVSTLTSVSVSFVGIIGFVDLIVPHIVRKIASSSHRKSIPLNFLIGGTFMILCDLFARTAASPREIPIGSITALLGAPFFAFIYLKKRKVK